MEVFCPDQIQQWMAFPFDFVNPARKAELGKVRRLFAAYGKNPDHPDPRTARN